MNKEIEEILDLLKRCDNTYLKIEDNDGKTKYEYQKVNDLRLDGYHSQLLLDYITNLQDNNKYLNKCNIELARRNDKAIDFISFICFNSERPLTINECHKLYAILKGSDK